VLVEEYLPGGSLRDQLRLRAYTRMQALDWLLDIARGLRALHEGPVCVAHRDLKPENIMLAADGRAKLVDLGLARLMHAPKHDPHAQPVALGSAESNAPGLSEARLTLLARADAAESSRQPDFVFTDRTGSERYMAPENFLGGAYDHRVDVFSYAVLAYELMSAGRAYEELYLTPEQIGRDVAERGLRPALPPHWPSAIAALLKRCWAHEPSARPEMREVLAELVAFRNTHDAVEVELLFSSPSALSGLRSACESCVCTIA
jgi:serine/threonine protein kinase